MPSVTDWAKCFSYFLIVVLTLSGLWRQSLSKCYVQISPSRNVREHDTSKTRLPHPPTAPPSYNRSRLPRLSSHLSDVPRLVGRSLVAVDGWDLTLQWTAQQRVRDSVSVHHCRRDTTTTVTVNLDGDIVVVAAVVVDRSPARVLVSPRYSPHRPLQPFDGTGGGGDRPSQCTVRLVSLYPSSFPRTAPVGSSRRQNPAR